MALLPPDYICKHAMKTNGFLIQFAKTAWTPMFCCGVPTTFANTHWKPLVFWSNLQNMNEHQCFFGVSAPMPGILWYPIPNFAKMVSYGILWYPIVSYGILWYRYPMVSSGIQWFSFSSSCLGSFCFDVIYIYIYIFKHRIIYNYI